jgi:hypothetical protein
MNNKELINIYFRKVLLTEGKKETIEFLNKNVPTSAWKDQADKLISTFTKADNTGKPIFPTNDVIQFFKWIKDNTAVNLSTIEKDYLDFKKFYPGKPLNSYKNYLQFTEDVHGKVNEQEYRQRNLSVKDDSPRESTEYDKEDLIADTDDILILRGSDERKCVKYGRGTTFCISRPGGGNMYGNYRIAKASTFYFIFFKQLPKSDPFHIMVLDHTKDGWEWTFGDNHTKKVDGGWEEVVAKFPILAQYEKYFVNKPLTEEEKAYHEKLSRFANNPTLENFNTYSYKEKADVLKFGMGINDDVFDSLDRDLRNEYVAVGPPISKNQFEVLSDSEKKQYTKIRISILKNELQIEEA